MLLAAWLGVGFIAWTFDGLVLTFGEIGLLPPPLAAWAPPLVFAAATVWLMLHDERRQVRRQAMQPGVARPA
jgi:lipopolysaccharide export LptBFGC system permease protein LptF